MNLLDACNYNPTTAVTKSTNSLLALTALDTTNLRLTVTVPAHGMLKFRLVCNLSTPNLTDAAPLLGVLSSTTVIGVVMPMRGSGSALSAEFVSQLEVSFTATGLTPGSASFDAAYRVEESAGASSGIKYGGPNNTTTNDAWGAFVFEAWDPQPLPTVEPGVANGLPVLTAGGTSSSHPAVEDVTALSDSTLATTHTITLPATANRGDLLLLLIAAKSGSSISSTSLDARWTLIESAGASTDIFEVWAMRAGGKEGGTTVTYTTNVTSRVATVIYRVQRGTWYGDTSDSFVYALDTNATSHASSAGPDLGAYTLPTEWTRQQSILKIAAVCFANDGTTVNTFPFGNSGTTKTSAVGASGVGLGYCHQRGVVTTTDNPDAFALSASVMSKAIIVYVRPAPVSVPVYIPSRIKRAVTVPYFTFLMTDSTNHLPATGLTGFTAQVQKDGGAFANISDTTVTEVGNGLYYVGLSASDLNGNICTFKFAATGADTRFERVLTQP